MILVTLLLVVLVAVYLYNTRTFTYWQKRGVKHDNPIIFFGTNLKVFLQQQSLAQMTVEQYWKYPKEKVVGLFGCSRPELLVRDPEVIKRVLVTDFSYFYPRGLFPSESVTEPLLKGMFVADGDMWKLMRQRMTPAFTSGKLKAMFPLVVERAERLQARTLVAAAAGSVLDARDLMARYTTEFIGACGFGLDVDCLGDEQSAFRKLGVKVVTIPLTDVIKKLLKEIFPYTFRNIRYFSRLEDEMVSIVRQILVQRNFEPSGRNDFIDFLLECRKKGTFVGKSIERTNPDGSPERVTLVMDEELIAAQVFVFFVAGFETSSSATSYTLHELAYNQNVQEQVQAEIDRVLAKYNNKISYDAISEMTYLQWTFKEGLRMFPSVGLLTRRCARDCYIPELGLTIEAGVGLKFSVHALHNDPQYFDNPSEFRPERFSPSEFDESKKYVYLPFGSGPRGCIGERLGLMQSLAGLAAVLSKFRVEPAPHSVRHPEIDTRSNIVQSVKHGLPLSFRLRDVARG